MNKNLRNSIASDMHALITDDRIIGNTLAAKLREYGVSADVCLPKPDIMLSRLSAVPAELTLYSCISGDHSRDYRNIRELRLEKPELKIVCAVYTSDNTVMNSCFDAGADACIVLPTDIERCAEIIVSQLIHEKGSRLPVIEEYLRHYGISDNNRGFEFLSRCMLMIIDEPPLIRHIVEKVYWEVGRQCGTTGSNVDRMLRHLAESAVKSGALINMTSCAIGSERPNNKTMLKALCKSFMYWYSWNSSRTLALSYSANWSDTLG